MLIVRSLGGDGGNELPASGGMLRNAATRRRYSSEQPAHATGIAICGIHSGVPDGCSDRVPNCQLLPRSCCTRTW